MDRRVRIGVDLGGSKIEGVHLTPSGEVAEKMRVNTPAGNYSATVDTVCDVIVRLMEKSAEDNCSVGIGTPGALFPAISEGVELMKNSNSVCLNDKPLKADIEKRLGMETRVENDANCFALSEACYGAAASARTVFGVILGTGVGSGIVIERRLHGGPNRIAGEWGHNCIPSSVRDLIDADRPCYCGRTNCIEAVLSGGGLSKTHLERTGNSLEAAKIAGLADSGDTDAGKSIGIYSLQLAICLPTVVNTLDPDMIVLGGGLSNIDQLYTDVPRLMREHVFTDNLLIQVAAPQFGDASGAIGTACLWPLN